MTTDFEFFYNIILNKAQSQVTASFQAWFIENTPNLYSTNQYFSVMFNKRNICLWVLVKLT